MKKVKKRLSPLERIIGQKSVVARLKVFAHSERRLPSILLTSPAGYGKTRITEEFAEEAGATLFPVNAVDIKDGASLNQMMRAPCTNEDGRSIIFIDESGEMKRKIGVALLTALESPYRLETRVKRKGQIEVWQVPIPKHVSFMFATTDLGKMHKALISRCIHLAFDDYLEDELTLIAETYLSKNGFTPDETASRGFGRVARSVRQLLQICDCAMIYNNRQMGESVLQKVLGQLQLTPNGLTVKDTKILNYLAGRAHASERDCLAYLEVEKEEYSRAEAWLRKNELIEICSHGRYITAKGLEEIGMDSKLDDNGFFGVKVNFDFGKNPDDLAFDPDSDQEHAYEIAGLSMAENLFGTTHEERVKILVHMLESTFGSSEHDVAIVKTMIEGMRLLREAADTYNRQLITVRQREQDDVE
jgi:Holliday junction resolvasome RuvABC ATP-dependent DNA helicase subunit